MSGDSDVRRVPGESTYCPECGMHFVMHHRTGEEMRECASAKYPCEGAHDHLYDYDPPPSERLRKPCSLCASAFEAIRSIAAGEGPRRTDAERLDAILAIVEGK